ncbi:hypothetical protein PR048_017211 [Dryococelus australis]|uniref:Uncharacterized protein n=1 Tax=Dryococelus australis TaxID=614101 RepID=A0ABQ9H8W2_9NEOP|nr:hypothetical protein PR048_017211 [Dryococelus australis]
MEYTAAADVVFVYGQANGNSREAAQYYCIGHPNSVLIETFDEGISGLGFPTLNTNTNNNRQRKFINKDRSSRSLCDLTPLVGRCLAAQRASENDWVCRETGSPEGKEGNKKTQGGMRARGKSRLYSRGGVLLQPAAAFRDRKNKKKYEGVELLPVISARTSPLFWQSSPFFVCAVDYRLAASKFEQMARELKLHVSKYKKYTSICLEQKQEKRRSGAAVRLLTSHLGEPGSILGWVAPGCSHAVIMPDDATSPRVFRGPPVSTALAFRRCSILIISPSSALKTSTLRAKQISPLIRPHRLSKSRSPGVFSTIDPRWCDCYPRRRVMWTAASMRLGVKKPSSLEWLGISRRSICEASIEKRALEELSQEGACTTATQSGRDVLWTRGLNLAGPLAASTGRREREIYSVARGAGRALDRPGAALRVFLPAPLTPSSWTPSREINTGADFPSFVYRDRLSRLNTAFLSPVGQTTPSPLSSPEQLPPDTRCSSPEPQWYSSRDYSPSTGEPRSIPGGVTWILARGLCGEQAGAALHSDGNPRGGRPCSSGAWVAQSLMASRIYWGRPNDQGGGCWG